MSKQYTYGNVSFGSFLAKEHYILEMNINTLEYLRDHGHMTHPADNEHLVATIKSMKAQERRIRKQLVKDGYFKS